MVLEGERKEGARGFLPLSLLWEASPAVVALPSWLQLPLDKASWFWQPPPFVPPALGEEMYPAVANLRVASLSPGCNSSSFNSFVTNALH